MCEIWDKKGNHGLSACSVPDCRVAGAAGDRDLEHNEGNLSLRSTGIRNMLQMQQYDLSISQEKAL